VGYGGGIYSGGVLTLTHSIVSHNDGRFGAGLFVPTGSGRQGVDSGHHLRHQPRRNQCGGLYANDAATTVAISNSIFTGNEAQNGGGLSHSNAALNVYDSSFTGNTATNGGGLLLEGRRRPCACRALRSAATQR